MIQFAERENIVGENIVVVVYRIFQLKGLFFVYLSIIFLLFFQIGSFEHVRNMRSIGTFKHCTNL